ncbi:MAG: DNA topoisomerase, partial [Bacteroidales bacterium]|nr:DNA topoisomerase [Bacteroidales bacterium]
MIVCIAEKPSVAADIARILGATKDCRVRGNGWYEGNGYQVTWTYGHLCELKNPDEYSPLWKAWALSTLPMIPQRFGIRLKEGVEEQFACIEKLFRAADRIINCGDAGQEGELIQRWVLQKSGAKCPVDRLWISSMTDEAIREGFANLKPQTEYQTLYEAGLCRAIGDWLLGMNATRLYTLKYGSNGSGYGQRPQPLSIGRVQTPTLALIVKRQQEIENFRPEPYWVLSTVYRDVTFTATPPAPRAGGADSAANDDGILNAEVTISPRSGGPRGVGFTNKEEAEKALRDIENTPFRVTKVEKKNGTEAPPRLFDLTSLQVECNKKFGYGADVTLNLIQQLYEGKYTTYPRVDTTFLPDDVYPKCGQILNGIANVPVGPTTSPNPSKGGETVTYGQMMQPLRGAKLKKSKKVFDTSKVTDHHAIIPTGVAPRGLTDMQCNVYDLIVRRFIAVFYPDCKFATTTVEGSPIITNGEGNQELYPVTFRATAKVITDPGWKVLFSNPNPTTPPANSAGATVPSASAPGSDTVEIQGAFVKGEEGPHIPTLTEKETQPPKPYTEATLLRAMETAGRMVDDEELRDAMKENGIGRPSTRAAIIQTLYKRGYMRKAGKSALEATPTGVELIGLIKEELLKSAELTGRWEKKLRQIESREYSAPQFIAELKQMVTDIVNQVLADPTNRRVTTSPSTTSPSPSEGGRTSP